MAEAILEVVLENLSSIIQKELGLFFGVNKEIKRLSSTLSTIRAVLEDAEEKQLTNPAIKNWLRKLTDAAFVLDDILDECSTHALRFQHGRLNEVHLSCSSYIHPKYVVFRAKIAKQMQEISETLDEIVKEKSDFHLQEVGVAMKTDVMEWRQTTSVIAEVEVYGRENDRNIIIETLIGEGSGSENAFVYPIVGIGGLGKTTLAQLVFNNQRITEHFDLKMWVCVSEDFSLKRILKDIIESAQGNSCGDFNLEALQKNLQEIIGRKRYLLVLDDMWNEDQEKWNRLKYILACGSKGASILVTTRLAKVAYVTRSGSVSPHQLSLLSDGDCWSLFKQRAFGPEKEETEELLAIGREIVKKCAGVPLAAKALGSLLRFKSEAREWRHVKESSLWNLPQDETSILPALRLSYLNLPLKLGQCFAFCAIFPKDFVMQKDLLIHLWMANGFISSSGTMAVEDIGDEICNELYWRSFFQDIKKDEFGDIFRFKMHDLIHDLAQSVMDDASCITVDKSASDLPRRTHHVSFHENLMGPRGDYVSQVQRLLTNYLDSLHSEKLGSLRTCLGPFRSPPVYFPKLLKFSSLRALTIQHVKKLPSSIGHLIHLRYLDISNGDFETLPESMCNLLNLQVLKLDYCLNLQKLPHRMRCLKALRHLRMSSWSPLSSIPPKLGQLTLLRRLSIYIVGEKRGRMLAELECLKLRGKLHIKHLERVKSAEDAKKANMPSKPLNTLLLSWDRNNNLELHENVENILEALEPHPNLADLGVGGYKGVHLPHWMGNPTFKALSKIELVDCENCFQLPSLGKLPALKSLIIHNMNHLRYIDEESYNSGVVTSFRALEHLRLNMLPNLERLSKEGGENIFPCLSHLHVAECPKLALPSNTSITGLQWLWAPTSDL